LFLSPFGANVQIILQCSHQFEMRLLEIETTGENVARFTAGDHVLGYPGSASVVMPNTAPASGDRIEAGHSEFEER
jgi:hypothetical protein